MADNFLSCTNNSISFLTLLQSLFTQDTNGDNYIRIIKATAADPSVGSPITCNNNDDFVQLFNKSIALAPDGLPAIRMISGDFIEGTGLSASKECGMESSLDLLSRLMFILDEDGNVAVNLANIV
jgi:hypothetical protein